MLCHRVRVEPSVASRLKRRISLALDAQGVVAKQHMPRRELRFAPNPARRLLRDMSSFQT